MYTFSLITVSAVTGYFTYAGECRERACRFGVSAAEILRVAREYCETMHHGQPLYKAVGIRVGSRRTSPVLWVR